jgi:methionine-rich copper-binding protein CopC
MVPGWANSHAKITSTVPADGDFVGAPQVLVLAFDNPVQLTGVELKTVDGEDRDVGSFPAEPATTFSIEVPQPLPPGEYYVVWRSIATDSHFSTGEFFFTVVAD